MSGSVTSPHLLARRLNDAHRPLPFAQHLPQHTVEHAGQQLDTIGRLWGAL
jgi:hypothetical protein